MIELNLKDAEVTRISTGDFYTLRKKPLDSIYIDFNINGFDKSVTFKDKSFNRIMDVIHKEIINLEHEDLFEMSSRKRGE